MRYPSLLRGAALTAAPVLVIGLATTAQATTGQAQVRSAGQAALTSAQARALSANVTDKVIVVMRNQLTSLPDTSAHAAARAASVHLLQSGVMSDLSATHAKSVQSYSLVNAVSATVSAGEAARLRTNPAVAEVVRDEPIPLATTKAGQASGVKPLPGACLPSKRVQLNPEAIENIHAATQSGKGDAAQALGITGSGVKVGWIADGIDTSNPDFIRKNGKHVFVDYQDFSGTGSNAPTGGGEAFLDASSIAAQGRHTYNVASYGVGLNVPCNIRVEGVAPGASLVGLNVFGSAEFAFNSVFLRAINYAVTHDHVNVLNESFGSNPFPDTASLDLTRMANDAAVKAGVTVTVSSGDAGITDTIGSPSTDPAVISAGASTTYRALAQTGIAGTTIPGVTGWLDNNVSPLSSAGFDQAGHTIDVVAPGDSNWALCTPNLAKFADCSNFAGKPASVELAGGTSESAPLTAGVAALVIQAYAKTHHGKHPSPAVVKQIIVSTAQDLNAPADQQGAGMIDAYAAVKAAQTKGASRGRTGHAVLKSATQLNATGATGTTKTFSDTLTNVGSGPVKIGLSSRTLSSYHVVATRALTLNTGNNFEAELTFHVAKGQARLNAAVAVPGDATEFDLFTPTGRLAIDSAPQGVGNFGDAQVTNPATGTWTAIVAGFNESGGSTETAHFQASTATWRKFGSLSASTVRLNAGKSRTIRLRVKTPARPGDQSGSIVLHTTPASASFTGVTTVPVTLRSLVPAPDPSTTFTGTLTGGNGRSTTTGQTAYYQMAIPAGLKALNVEVSTPNAANTMLAELVDPATGEAASTAFNGLAQTSGGTTTLTPETGAQLHVVKPAAGKWTLIVDFFNSVSGTAVSQPFTVKVNDTPVTATAAGLPDSASTQLAAGTPVTVPVQVTNNGSTPEEFFVDPRLAASSTQKLASQTTSSLSLPNLKGTTPTYLVPSHTTALAASAASTANIYFDFSWAFGDPDLASTTSKTPTGSLTSAAVADGEWTVTPFLQGPTGPNQAAPHPTTTSLSATTADFDPAVTSASGDLWAQSVNTAAPFTPVVANPGQTVTINVTIDPAGASGTPVTGTLYVSAYSLIPSAATFNELAGNAPEGSDVAAFPYSYTIK